MRDMCGVGGDCCGRALFVEADYFHLRGRRHENMGKEAADSLLGHDEAVCRSD